MSTYEVLCYVAGYETVTVEAKTVQGAIERAGVVLDKRLEDVSVFEVDEVTKVN